MRVRPATVIALIAAWACGCASRAPTYQWTDHETALRLMSERAARLRTLQSEARLVLTSPEGRSMTLDAAIAAAPPDRLRLRAWKLGHAVLDLTHTPEGTWVKTAETPDHGPGESPADLRALDAASLAGAWSILTGDVSAGATGEPGPVRTMDTGGPTFTVRRAVSAGAGPPGGSLVCDIDRHTLTVRRCRFVDAGAERGVVTLDGYRDFDGIVFPTRISATGGQGSVLLVLHEPEFNLPLAEAAFEPPAGAIRQE